MPKVLCWIGIVISLLVALTFVLDLAIAVPFARFSLMLDIVFLLVAGCTTFLGWTTLRALK